mgnify:CR=1 FL=1
MSDQNEIIEQLQRKLDRLAKTVERLGTREAGETSARCYSAAGQSIPDNAYTIVNFNTVDFDPDGLVTTGSDWAFTAPVGGRYAVTACAAFVASTAWAETEAGLLAIFVEGVNVSKLARKDHYSSASTVVMTISGSDLVSLDAGERLDIRVYQNSGGALNLIADALLVRVAIWLI